ncbi:hypothetical protein O181_073632 [Austropuccinia psidii MF-1]|uniref:Uncharacterized protein n=1 Tax=Austropuccinia psidii MF-1 TaxID=1389203 RepID=A0A9Q3F9E8_9BASI|nr:hypothetical protein [Austropuccinia psidii MF-1]
MRQKEKVSHQEKKPPVTGSNSSRPPLDSSSKRSHHKKNKRGQKFQAPKDKPHSALLNKDNKLIGSEKERRIKEGLCTYCGAKHPIEKCFKRPQNKPGSSRGFPSKKDSSGINSSASNSLATAVNSVALVGELKTPSLPSSVHIPSIMSSHSLLKSRDEVFKEIKDVGEDVAISSLHLFQENMELCPLSFHASLGDQWDEEEKPE